jgi:hypothetical protein
MGTGFVTARAAVQRLVAVAGIAGWFGFNAVMAFYVYLTRVSPDAPDFARQLRMPMHQHGRIFYVQFWEQRVVLIGLALSLILVAAAAVLGLTIYRRRLIPQAWIGWLNASALAAFAALAAYWHWP